MSKRRVTRWMSIDLSKLTQCSRAMCSISTCVRFIPTTNGEARSNNDFLPDHGHLMHLYAIREPEMDAVFHLHPVLAGAGDFRISLPAMPAGDYTFYGDVVHANGFPETLVSKIIVPANMPGGALGPDDAAALRSRSARAQLGNSLQAARWLCHGLGSSFNHDCKHRLHLPLPTSGCQRQACSRCAAVYGHGRTRRIRQNRRDGLCSHSS